MSVGAAIVVGAVIGLTLGIVVSLTTDVPLHPKSGRCLVGLSDGSRAAFERESPRSPGLRE
jgi:hypothetical protein